MLLIKGYKIIIATIITITITKSIKKKYKKGRESITEIFQKMKKITKKIILTIEIKVCQMWIDRKIFSFFLI